jgi:hypothetical protein
MSYVKCPSKVNLCVKEYAKLIDFIKKPLTNNDGFLPTSQQACGTELGDTCSGTLQYIMNNILNADFDLYARLNGTNNKLFLQNLFRYNLAELIRRRTGYKTQMDKVSFFGSYQWWKENIWGTNRLTKYIYIICVCIAFMGLIFFSWRLLNEIANKDMLIPLIIIGVLTLFFVVLSIINISIESMVDGDETMATKYAKIYDIISPLQKWSQIILAVVGLILGIVFIRNNNKSLQKIALILLVPVIISLNFYFSFYMPQLLILGVFIQYIILIQRDTKINYIIGAIVGLTVIGFLFTKYIMNKENIYYDDCTESTSTSNTLLVQLSPYLLVLATLGVIIYTSQANNARIVAPLTRINLEDWGLYLSPFAKFISKI